MAVDVTRRDAMVPAEVVVADAAGQRTGVAGDVARLAHREPADRRRVALRAGEGPIARAIQPSLGEERCAYAVTTDELPLCALDEQLAFRELYRMHDRTYLMPSLLLGAPPRVLGLDRPLIRCLGARSA